MPRNPSAIFAACALLLAALPMCAARADAPPLPPAESQPQAPPPADSQPQTQSHPHPQPQSQDLGEGLSYFRVTHLAPQLPEIRDALEKQRALVLDLRGAEGNHIAAQALRDTLASAKPGARVARLVLVNAATAPAIPFALGGGIDASAIPGVLVIAPAPASVPADVKAPCSTGDDSRACEAIDRGVPLYTLINHQPDKPRNDEAALVREQNNETQPDATTAPDAAPATASAPATDAAAPPPPPLTDSVLQLAVQVHRSLLALKKL